MTVCPTCGRPMAEPVAAGSNTMTGSANTSGPYPAPRQTNPSPIRTPLPVSQREYDRLAEEWAGVSPSDYVAKIPGNILTGRRTPIDPMMQTSSYPSDYVGNILTGRRTPIDPAMQTSSYRPNTTNTGSVVSPMTSSAPANPMDGWISRQQNNAGVGGNSLWDMWRNRIGR